MTAARRYIGAIDWFSALNSVIGRDCVKAPTAWHHANTGLPFHMGVAAVLAGKYD